MSTLCRRHHQPVWKAALLTESATAEADGAEAVVFSHHYGHLVSQQMFHFDLTIKLPAFHLLIQDEDFQ